MIGANELATFDMELRSSVLHSRKHDALRILFPFKCTKKELLGHIKSLTVIQVYHEFHQMNFHMMSQEEGEPILTDMFLCRLRPSFLSSTSPVGAVMLSVMLSVMHLGRPEVGCMTSQRRPSEKIVTEAGTLTTLDTKIKQLQLLETTEESTGILLGHTWKKYQWQHPSNLNTKRTNAHQNLEGEKHLRILLRVEIHAEGAETPPIQEENLYFVSFALQNCSIVNQGGWKNNLSNVPHIRFNQSLLV